MKISVDMVSYLALAALAYYRWDLLYYFILVALAFFIIRLISAKSHEASNKSFDLSSNKNSEKKPRAGQSSLSEENHKKGSKKTIYFEP